MPVFRLTEEVIFPPPHLASEEGLLAVGGDLTPARLVLAYQNGIFPWYGEEDPILWWSPDPRFVLFPDRLKISRTMKGLRKKNLFSVTFDSRFREVVTACRETRRSQGEGTWITAEMMAAYIRLHEMGLAHSVEAWQEGGLVGGLYGVSLGKCFFGESMFTRVPNASKAAFIELVKTLEKHDFRLVDCQVYTDHLYSLGAEMIARGDFLPLLRESLDGDTLRGNWRMLMQGGSGTVVSGDGEVPVSFAREHRRVGSPYFVSLNKSLS